ncbi:hypothetical protein [Nostoc sp. DedQUE07]|uniref:hypothetical protein n=1 Tax=Nostoc sp. DedQUE07 TaxID=3075392 RepID=UPI002AD28FF2|nr:hypothetical protein [Nostoc sp. DedQUE07]MDZ8131911.1 hypothetical protein [Nostoc sp. DedQUE07]
MSTKTEEALQSQTELLNKFSGIIRNLLKYISALKEDLQETKAAATAQLAQLLGVDDSTSASILASNPDIQALIDEATAALPSEQVESDTATSS